MWPSGAIQPVQRVRISNMSLTSSSSAIKFEASTVSNRTDVGDIFDIEINGVRIRDTNRGIGIWQRSGERRSMSGKGRIRDILIRNVDSVTRFDSKPQFWGSGEPFVLTVLPRNGDCCIGLQNITLANITAVAENSALISSLGTPSAPGASVPPPIGGVRLMNVSITIKKTGNTSRPQLDYRPSSTVLPQTVPNLVAGIVIENVNDIELEHKGGVRFSPLLGPGKQAYWGMSCLNASASSHVHVEAGWTCANATHR